MEYSFKEQINEFTSYVDSMSEIKVILMDEISKTADVHQKTFVNWIKQHARKTEEGKSGTLTLTIAPKEVGDFERLVKKVNRIMISVKMLPRQFVISLISIFDAYLGSLVKGILITHPNILTASEKNLSYSDLLSFKSFKDAKEHIIEIEIETLLRKSHSDQFHWLENRLGIGLLKDLDVWPFFIEVTERRNLFVHTGGFVSRHYLQVCEANGVQFKKKPKVGNELFVTREYFDEACDVILEIGIKLGHVIWRKIRPSEIEKVDKSLNNMCVDMITNNQHDLSIKLLDFVIKCDAWKSSMGTLLCMELNLAQAYKWNGEKKKCDEILASRDFSALSDKYKLAYAVLKDDFHEAVKIMKKIGKSGEIPEAEYKLWPIFREFRKKPAFEKAYKEIFKKDFKIKTEKPIGIEKKKKSKKKRKQIKTKK